jgi:hypothetical protein
MTAIVLCNFLALTTNNKYIKYNRCAWQQVWAAYPRIANPQGIGGSGRGVNTGEPDRKVEYFSSIHFLLLGQTGNASNNLESSPAKSTLNSDQGRSKAKC